MKEDTAKADPGTTQAMPLIDSEQSIDATSPHQRKHERSGSGRLEVRCPSCHQPLEIAVDTPLTDLTCSTCGSHFSLVDQSQATRMAPPLSTMGRFELIERIGVGGFGSVWKARDKELDRTVAVKVPRQGGMTPEEQEKFFREARAAAQLRHPSIVSVHEVGRDGDSVYIVSDFIRGITLGDWLTGQKPTFREAAELCAEIADALHHAHEHGVVHRDLKPSNIMMDAEGKPHLMDFGLARREVGEVTMTLDGQVLGTPAYMSPEQAKGEAHAADRRSDVYSLGVILFQLLTGELPFRGNARMLMHQVIHDEPPSPRKLNLSIRKDLETITLTCLEKQPTRRFQTALEFADELRRFLSNTPIHSRPVGRLTRSWRWCQRKPAVATLAALVLIASALGFAGITWQWRTAVLSRNRAERAELEAYTAALNGYGMAADSLLVQARMMRGGAPEQASQDKALEAISEIGSVWSRAKEAIKQFPTQTKAVPNDVAQRWENRLHQSRVEATRWLTESRIWRVGTVMMPESNPQKQPFIAASPDGERFAAFYPAANEVIVFDNKGVTHHRQQLRSANRFGVGMRMPEQSPLRMSKVVAFSPDLNTMALIRPDAPAIDVVSTDTGETISLPVPTPTAPAYGPAQLMFSDNDQIVLILPVHISTPAAPVAGANERDDRPMCMVWKRANGRWDFAQRRAENLSKQFDARDIVTLSNDQAARARDFGGVEVSIFNTENESPSKAIFSIGQAGSAGWGERCYDLRFTADAKRVAALTSARGLIIDCESGAHAELRWSERGPTHFHHDGMSLMLDDGWISIADVVPFQTGFVTLERPTPQRVGPESIAPWRLGLWEAALPRVPVRTLSLPLDRYSPTQRTTAICLTDDGTLVIPSRIGPTKWRQGKRLTARPTQFGAWQVELERDFLITSRLRYEPYEVKGRYGGGSGSHERKHASIHSLSDGQLLKSFSTDGANHLLAMSKDCTIAAVASDVYHRDANNDNPSEDYIWDFPATEQLDRFGSSVDSRPKITGLTTTVSVWSLGEHRTLAEVGRFRKAVAEGGDIVEGRHESGALAAAFSPDQQWLLIKQEANLGIWKLPEVKYVGRVKLPVSAGEEFRFDAGPERVTVASSGGRRSFSLIDLPNAKLLYDSGANDSPGPDSIARRISATDVSTVSFNDAVYVETFDLETQKANRWQVGTQFWKEARAVLNGDNTRLLVYGEIKGDTWSDELPHAELWNLTEKELLRDFTGDGRAYFNEWTVFADRYAVNLSPSHPGESENRPSQSICWKWADGTNVDKRGRILLLATEDQSGWAVELTDSKLTLRHHDRLDGVLLDMTPRLDASKRPPEPSSLRIAPNSSRCVLTLGETFAGLFDVETGKLLVTFPQDHRFGAFDSSGNWCATIGQDRRIILWDTRTAKPVHTTLVHWPFGGESFQQMPIKVHPSGTRLALWTHGALVLWDVEQSRPIKVLDPPGHLNSVTSVAEHSSTMSVASGGSGGEIVIWSAETGSIIRGILADGHPIAKLAMHPDGSKLAYVTTVGTVGMFSLDGKQIWRIGDGEGEALSQRPEAPGRMRSAASRDYALQFHPAGDFLAVGTAKGYLLFLDASSGESRASIPIDSTAITSIAFSHDGSVLAAGSAGGRLHFWQAPKRIRTLKVGSPIRDIAFAGGADVLISGSDRVQFWKTETLDEVLRLTATKPPVEAIEVDATSGRLYVADQGDEVVVHDLNSLQDRLEVLGVGLTRRLPEEKVKLDPHAGELWKQLLRETSSQARQESNGPH